MELIACFCSGLKSHNVYIFFVIQTFMQQDVYDKTDGLQSGSRGDFCYEYIMKVVRKKIFFFATGHDFIVLVWLATG